MLLHGHVWVCGHAVAGVGPWLVVSVETMGKSLVWAVAWNHMNVQGLCRTGPGPPWLHTIQHLGEQAPVPCLSSTVELALVVRWVGVGVGRVGRLGGYRIGRVGGVGCEGGWEYVSQLLVQERGRAVPTTYLL